MLRSIPWPEAQQSSLRIHLLEAAPGGAGTALSGMRIAVDGSSIDAGPSGGRVRLVNLLGAYVAGDIPIGEDTTLVLGGRATYAAVDAESCEAEIEANQVALEKAGHWGVPTLVFDGEPFFGQDRIDMAIWRMERKGLTPR